MTHKEWNNIDAQLSRLIADLTFKVARPEEWRRRVSDLQALLEPAPED